MDIVVATASPCPLANEAPIAVVTNIKACEKYDKSIVRAIICA